MTLLVDYSTNRAETSSCLAVTDSKMWGHSSWPRRSRKKVATYISRNSIPNVICDVPDWRNLSAPKSSSAGKEAVRFQMKISKKTLDSSKNSNDYVLSRRSSFDASDATLMLASKRKEFHQSVTSHLWQAPTKLFTSNEKSDQPVIFSKRRSCPDLKALLRDESELLGLMYNPLTSSSNTNSSRKLTAEDGPKDSKPQREARKKPVGRISFKGKRNSVRYEFGPPRTIAFTATTTGMMKDGSDEKTATSKSPAGRTDSRRRFLPCASRSFQRRRESFGSRRLELLRNTPSLRNLVNLG